ncbi:MAG: hypothetical protein EXS32_16105 [Opitutus sp.]|nr:hypothetical protein [Opitutus sp.]
MRTETTDNGYHLWSVPPPLPAGAQTPEWLLDLAVICAGKTLNEDGLFMTATEAFGKIADIRRTLADLPDDAPEVEWGRWFLAVLHAQHELREMAFGVGEGRFQAETSVGFVRRVKERASPRAATSPLNFQFPIRQSRLSVAPCSPSLPAAARF